MNDITNNNGKEDKYNNSKNKIDEKSTASYHDKISKDAWITLAILSLIGLIIVYGETMIIPAIPDLVEDFNIPYNTTAWILTAYLIAGAVATPIVGKLSDIYGKKRILLLVMIIYTAGTSFGIISNDISTMIIVRTIQGIGMSVFPIAFTIIREKFPENKLSIAQGILTSIFAAGGVIGLSLGATTIEYFGWRSTFISISPLALFLTVIIMRFIHVKEQEESNNNTIPLRKSIDIKGAIALTITISSFLISITLLGNSNSTDFNNTNNNTINSSLIILFSILSIISLFIFVLFQRRTHIPLIDINLLKDRILLPTNILLMTIGISMFMIYQTISILIRNPPPAGFGGSAIDAANVQLPFMIISLIISVLSGFLVSRFGNIKPTIIGSVISVIGFSSLLMYHSTEFEIIINLSIIAGGLSLAEVGGFNITLVSVSPKVSGISMGITVLLFLIGMSIGPAISGIYLETFQSPIMLNKISYSFPSAYEGTNGIQAADLVGRKLSMRRWRRIRSARPLRCRRRPPVRGVRTSAVRREPTGTIDTARTATDHLAERSTANPDALLSASTPYLRLLGTVVCAGLLARAALAVPMAIGGAVTAARRRSVRPSWCRRGSSASRSCQPRSVSWARSPPAPPTSSPSPPPNSDHVPLLVHRRRRRVLSNANCSICLDTVCARSNCLTGLVTAPAPSGVDAHTWTHRDTPLARPNCSHWLSTGSSGVRKVDTTRIKFDLRE